MSLFAGLPGLDWHVTLMSITARNNDKSKARDCGGSTADNYTVVVLSPSCKLVASWSVIFITAHTQRGTNSRPREAIRLLTVHQQIY